MERWYVLFTKPRMEPQVHLRLLQRGLQAYLPLMPQSSFAAIPKPPPRRRPQPLFPRYLFAHLDLACATSATVRWIPGLINFVTFGDEYAVVDDTVIAHLEARLAHLRERARSPFQPGQRVRLLAAQPLSMLDAVFEKPLSGGERAQILIEFLGRFTRCEVAVSALEAADPSAWPAG